MNTGTDSSELLVYAIKLNVCRILIIFLFHFLFRLLIHFFLLLLNCWWFRSNFIFDSKNFIESKTYTKYSMAFTHFHINRRYIGVSQVLSWNHIFKLDTVSSTLMRMTIKLIYAKWDHIQKELMHNIHLMLKLILKSIAKNIANIMMF